MPDTDSPSPEDTAIGRLYYGRHRTTFRIGTYLALVRMMGIAHLVTALYGHALLVSETHARLARTRRTLRDLICGGFDSPAGRAAVRRLREVTVPSRPAARTTAMCWAPSSWSRCAGTACMPAAG